MKQLILVISLFVTATAAFAQEDKSYVHKGNELYQQQKYKEAEANYRKSVEKKNQNLEGNFNLGDALYKEKKFDDAGKQFTDIGAAANNKNVAAGAYHNLGNSLLQSKKYQESIDAYKKALLNNPKDDQTRYNLAYAREMLKKQQQQQKQQNKPDQNKDKNNQNKDQQNKDQQNKDNKDQNKKDQDKNNQDKDQNKPDQNKQDQKNGQQQQPQQDKLSKDDAQRMLDALNNDEQKTQDKLKNKKLKGEKAHISKDW